MTDELLQAWGVLNCAIGAMLLCQPAQMSEAANRRESARANYETLVMTAAHAAARQTA